MKGKGKGSEECPLQFPDVSPVDHVQECPRYTTIAQGDATVSLEDLEPLQLELETLLVSVCERRRRLAHETQLLLSWQEKKIPVGGSGTPSAPGKRSRVSPDGKPSKKFRDGGKVFTGGRPPRKQVASSSSTLATGVTTEEGPSVARNDAPNRFWASLEPYCGHVTADDVRALEELMRAREEEASEYQRVPPLGRHYAQRWAQEDLQEEQTQGARAAGGGAQGARSPQQTRGSLNCDNSSSGGNNSKGGGAGEPLGSLTQRLVSCLLEENLLCPPLEDNQLGPPLGPSPGLAQQLERRVRRELREHGLLTETDNPDDQVLAELRRCQAELRSVSNRNGAQLNALLRRARESLAQQELNRRLRVADHELLEAWRRMAQARQRKKTPSKKDRDLAAKALRDRQALLKQRPSSLQR